MRVLPRYTKTRIAPTPSGFLHLGNVLNFAVTAALARQSGAKTVLRIDDMDRARVDAVFVQDIFDTLSYLEIPWHEGPLNAEEFEDAYSQTHRLPLYLVVLEQLRADGFVYACTCSRKQLTANICDCDNKHLPLNAANTAWRLHTAGMEVTVKNYDGEPVRAVLPAGMRDFIVKKKDGYPAYQLTSVIDDLFYGIDLVVRGHDLWPSTLGQHTLASALGRDNFSRIAFLHHPLLMETSGKKLSKSAGSTSVRYLRKNGKTMAEIYALIGVMAGLKQSINNWEQLGGAILGTFKD